MHLGQLRLGAPIREAAPPEEGVCPAPQAGHGLRFRHRLLVLRPQHSAAAGLWPQVDPVAPHTFTNGINACPR
jgi:hypothetical protein